MRKALSILEAAAQEPDTSESVRSEHEELCQAAAESLHRLFASRHGDNEAYRCYVLIDPSRRNAVQDEVFAEFVSATNAPLEPIRWRHPKLVPQHRPLLLPLDLSKHDASEVLLASLRMATEDLQPASLQQGQGQRIAGWLLSPAEPLTLARHLGALSVQDLPAGLPVFAGRRRSLRFHDPLVWPVLWQLSRPEQRAALLGPVSNWCWLDPKLSLHTVAGNVAPRDSSTEQEPATAWDAQQWLTLLALNAFNAAATQRSLSQETLDRRPIVLDVLGRMAQRWVEDERDLKALARLALVHPCPFDLHPHIRSLLDGRPSQQWSSATLEQLPDDDWQRICKELADGGR